MTSGPLPVWAGRTLALVGVIVLALNLRTAVAAVSPIAGDIARDIGLSSAALGVLGALPPVAFAISGLVAPLVARRLGLEWTLVLAGAAMVLGHLVRGLAPDYWALLAGSVLVLAGMGFGNILLPPVVKRYFPDRVGLVTTVYVSLMSISTTLPALVAVPVAEGFGWRVSLGIWAVFATASVLPWLALVLRERRRGGDEADELEAPAPVLFAALARSRVAWALAIGFTVPAFNAYVVFAWLPRILVDTAGVSTAAAGALLGLYAIMGLPAALIIPVLATRMRNVGILLHVGAATLVLGYGGLLVAPAAAPVLWVVLAGIGPLMFPVLLVLINLRSRTHHTSIALSGFVQAFGYTVGALGPLLVGFLHEATGSWTPPVLVLLATAIVGVTAGILLAKPVFVDDELGRAAR